MDDLNAKLSGILSDPEAMKEIAALASSLGVDTSGVHKAPEQPKPAPSDSGALSMMTSLMPMLGSMSAEDDTTRLLDAIRPFLSEERRQKLDKAKKLIRIMRLMPMLKEFNFLDL